jgi:YD repeat-containing protein
MKKILAFLSFTFVFNIVNAQNNPGSLIKKLKVLEEIVTQGPRQAADIKFDSSGNCISHKYVDFTRELTPAWLLNIYSGPRLIRSFFTFSPSPNDTTVYDYIYDSKGNLSALVDKNGHFDTKYAYDSSGKMIKEIGFGKFAVVEHDF